MKYLYATQIEAQRAVSRQVHAYPLWVSGSMIASKWKSFTKKMEELYGIDLSPAARYYWKKKGKCSSILIGYPFSQGDNIRWILMTSEAGDGLIKTREKLQDARKNRIVWGDYVLMYLTRPREWGGGSRWTWCLTKQVEMQEYNYLTALSQAAASNNQPERLKKYIETLLRRPMHSCIRTQIAKMLRRAIKVWDRHSHGKPWPGPDPKKLPYLGHFKKGGFEDPVQR